MGIIYILCGLPGCGKTHFANSKKDKNTLIVDCDSLTTGINTLEGKIYNYIVNHLYGNYKQKKVILDGLFLKVDDVVSMIQYLNKAFDGKFSFEVEYWPADIETCLKNDSGRREISSTFTIEHGVLEEMTEDIFKEKLFFSVPVHNHKTILKEEYKLMVDEMQKNKISVKDSRYLYSSDWYVGAEYPDRVYISKEEKVPSDFVELDEILEKYFPEITYLQYKRLKRECVELDDFDETDYYTGTVYEARYVCDLKKLYAFIKERNKTNKLPTFC